MTARVAKSCHWDIFKGQTYNKYFMFTIFVRIHKKPISAYLSQYFKAYTL